MPIRRSTDEYESYVDYNPRKQDPFKENINDRYEQKTYTNPDDESGDWDDMETEEDR